MPYIFYDFETTGLEKSFDQFVQFGAIHTDDELNEIDSINLRCRRLPHVIPSPVAMRVTRLRPEDLEECELSHYEATARILDWCGGKGPCVFVGYNSMEFDETFLRQSLYQNLQDPYLTNTRGNGRADIMYVAQGYFHHAPDVLTVPDGAAGRFVFKLGPLVRANGIEFSEEEAHDALADVRATIAIARLMKDALPELWDTLIGYASRYRVDDFMADEEAFFASFVFGGRPFSYLVTEAARNVENGKNAALFDLTHDPAKYLSMDRDNLVKVLNGSPKVIRSIATNKQPMLVPLDRPSHYLKGDVPSEAVLRSRARQIKEADEFRQTLAEALPLRYEPKEPSEHVEEQIYDGFPDQENRAVMAKFHLTDWPDRYEVVQEFTDERLRKLGTRLVCGADINLVPEDERAEYNGWLQQRHFSEAEAGWRTVDKALTEIDDLERENPDDAAEFQTLREYILEIAADPE